MKSKVASCKEQYTSKEQHYGQPNYCNSVDKCIVCVYMSQLQWIR